VNRRSVFACPPLAAPIVGNEDGDLCIANIALADLRGHG
jgi:hypothetical protein